MQDFFFFFLILQYLLLSVLNRITLSLKINWKGGYQGNWIALGKKNSMSANKKVKKGFLKETQAVLQTKVAGIKRMSMVHYGIKNNLGIFKYLRLCRQ